MKAPPWIPDTRNGARPMRSNGRPRPLLKPRPVTCTTCPTAFTRLPSSRAISGFTAPTLGCSLRNARADLAQPGLTVVSILSTPRDEFTADSLKSQVHRAGVPEVSLAPKYGNLRMKSFHLLENGSTVICGSIVDNQNVRHRIRISDQRFKTADEAVSAIVVDHYYRHQWPARAVCGLFYVLIHTCLAQILPIGRGRHSYQADRRGPS